MTWTTAVKIGLRRCLVYEDFLEKMAKQIVKHIDEKGLNKGAIIKGLRLCGVNHDDVMWMAEEVYQTCLEEYKKGNLR